MEINCKGQNKALFFQNIQLVDIVICNKGDMHKTEYNNNNDLMKSCNLHMR